MVYRAVSLLSTAILHSSGGMHCKPLQSEIGAEMIDQVETMLRGIQWDKSLVEEFLGQMLTEPKQQVVFDPPEAPMSRGKFRQRLRQNDLALDPRSQLLFTANHFYLNGEKQDVPPVARAAIRELADHRSHIDIDTVELTDGRLITFDPIGAVIITDVKSAIIPEDKVAFLLRIDPQGMMISMHIIPFNRFPGGTTIIGFQDRYTE